MSITKQTYSAPTLTYYGKLADLTQVGSLLFSKDITGDGQPELFYDDAVDGAYGGIRTVVVPGGNTLSVSPSSAAPSSSGQVMITYDTNEDNEPDLQIIQSGNFFSLGPVIDVSVVNSQGVWDLRDGVQNTP